MHCLKTCPYSEFFLVGIFQHLNWIPRDMEYAGMYPNVEKYRPKKVWIRTLFTAWWLCINCFRSWIPWNKSNEWNSLSLDIEITLPQVFFKHFASKNQLHCFYINWTLVEKRLMFQEHGLNIEPLSPLQEKCSKLKPN